MSDFASIPPYYGSTIDVPCEADNAYYKQDAQPPILFTAPAQQTPQDLAEAKDLKGKIAVFLNKYLGKSSSKAKNIVQKLPTNDTHQLNNILKALTVLRMNTIEFARLNEALSWASSFQDYMLCQCCKDTSAEDRLVLRALTLYNFAGVDAGLYDDRRDDYLSALDLSTGAFHGIKSKDHGQLSGRLRGYKSSVIMRPDDVAYNARIAVLPTILSELEKLYRD